MIQRGNGLFHAKKEDELDAEQALILFLSVFLWVKKVTNVQWSLIGYCDNGNVKKRSMVECCA